MILYAIFKNGFHKGNERAISGIDAIKKYIIASNFSEFLNDEDFVRQYSYTIAIEGIHFKEIVL